MAVLSELLDSLQPTEIRGETDGVTISSLALRTDAVEQGTLFCCVPGRSADGHDYAGAAVEAGAVALLVERNVDAPPAVVQIQVEDVRAAMADLANAFYGKPSERLTVLGVTGTNGKTTTSHLVRAMFEAGGTTCGLVGTIGAIVGGAPAEVGFTTPESIDLQRLFAQMIDAGDTACAIEVSSHALEQKRSRGVTFAAVGFTNLSQDHLDYHVGFEGYYQAKRRLFTERGPDGRYAPAAVNCDGEWGSRLFEELVHEDRDGVPVWGYTLEGMRRASVSAEHRLTAEGATLQIESPVGDFELRSRLHGRFNVENVLCATTMALLAGVSPEQIQRGLDTVGGVPGRFEPVATEQPFEVIVDYAHTPDSLENVLTTARELTRRKLVVVFGCGGDRDRGKRPLMGQVAAREADVVYVTNDNPRSEEPATIISEIVHGTRTVPGGAQVHVQEDRRTAIHDAIAGATEGDVVVIAGKGHEQGQQFATETLPFDDADVAREALAALVGSRS